MSKQPIALTNYWNGYRKAKRIAYDCGLESAARDKHLYTHGKSDTYYKGYCDYLSKHRKAVC